jgi:hypothetical protein
LHQAQHLAQQLALVSPAAAADMQSELPQATPPLHLAPTHNTKQVIHV